MFVVFFQDILLKSLGGRVRNLWRNTPGLPFDGDGCFKGYFPSHAGRNKGLVNWRIIQGLERTGIFTLHENHKKSTFHVGKYTGSYGVFTYGSPSPHFFSHWYRPFWRGTTVPRSLGWLWSTYPSPGMILQVETGADDSSSESMDFFHDFSTPVGWSGWSFTDLRGSTIFPDFIEFSRGGDIWMFPKIRVPPNHPF